jgi:tetratricopeptide (TPR) repeat protein
VLSQRRGKLAPAEATLRQVVSIREKALAADHPQIAQARLALGSVLREAGRPAEAHEIQAPAAEVLLRFHGPNHPDAATASLELGRTLGALGRLDEARASLAEALARRQELFGQGHPRTIQAREALASIASRPKSR